MSIIKQYHKSSGITYVYESESYWDKEKKQPRSRRKLIGKLDDETGEIIPTGKKGRSRKKDSGPDVALPPEATSDDDALRRDLHRLEEENRKLREHSCTLEEENRVLRNTLEKIGELIKKV